MTSFLLAFAVGIAIVCSFAGWGALIVRVLRIQFATGFGFRAALGMAFSTSVGALLNWFRVISPNVIRTYVLAGLLIAVFVGARHARSSSRSIVSAWARIKPQKFLVAGVLLLVLVTLDKYSTAVSPGAFHPQDDYHAYFVFPVEMLQTGSLGADPFSERRIVSSLGGKFFLDTLPLSLTGEVRNFRLMDEGVAFLIVLLLVAEIMIRKGIPAVWTLLALLAVSAYPAPLSNITAVYCGVALLLLLFDMLDRRVTYTGLNDAALIAVVLAGLTSLKTTFAPMAGVFFLGFFMFQLFRLPSRGKAIVRAVFCVLLIVALLLPWMVYSYRVSGTLFYPLFGKGFHGSRYGTYLLPTAGMGLHNLLAFFDGLANALGAILAAQVCLIFLAYRRNKNSRLTDLVLVVNLLIDVIFIGIGTGGVQMFRYSFAILFAIAIFLLIQELTVFAEPSALSPLSSADNLPAVLLLGMLVGTAWHGFAAEQRDWRLQALKFGLTGQDVKSASEVAAYRDIQLSIPPGQAVLVRLDKNFLLDFRRNPVYVNDLPGGASLPPGIPIFKGPEALADYLLDHGIRYLAYSYGDEASFSRAEFGNRLDPDVNVWIRKGAQIAFDFQDNAVLLARTRKKLFDNGNMFVLDLATRVSSNSANVAGASRQPVPFVH